MNELSTFQSSRYIYALIKSSDSALLRIDSPTGMGDAPIELIAAGGYHRRSVNYSGNQNSAAAKESRDASTNRKLGC